MSSLNWYAECRTNCHGMTLHNASQYYNGQHSNKKCHQAEWCGAQMTQKKEIFKKEVGWTMFLVTYWTVLFKFVLNILQFAV